MSRRRRRRNPSGTDIALLAGLVVGAGTIGYYLYTKSAAAAPALNAPGYGQAQTITLSAALPALTVNASTGQTFTVQLPAGASWVSIQSQNLGPGGGTNPPVARSGNSPITWIYGAAVTATTTFNWTDSSGVMRTTAITFTHIA
jgi:hypothetical protein